MLSVQLTCPLEGPCASIDTGPFGQDEIKITNGLNGPVSIDAQGPSSGQVSCTLSKRELKSGEEAVLRAEFHYQGQPLRAKQFVTIWVQPFGREVSFEIELR